MKLSPPILEAVRVSLGMRVDHFSQKTVIMLMRHIDALDEENKQIKTDEARAVAAADRLQGDVIRLSNEIGKARIAEEDHIRTIAGLRKEIRRLQDEVDEVREAKKVPIPRDVATVLADWQKWYSLESLPYDLFHPSDKTRGLDIVRTYAVLHFDNFLAALRYGYTIELTNEDKFTNAVTDLIKGWDGRPGGALALEITRLYKSFYAEQSAANG